MRPAALLLALGLAACAGPPPEAYVGGSRGPASGIGLGRNLAGEACTQQAAGAGADIFCGAWDQPSGRVVPAGAGEDGTDLRAIATSSPWRNALDSRFVCGEPSPSTILGGAPAVVLSCTRKAGGWPQAALAARVDGRTYLADGILPAVPVLEQSIAILSGRTTAQAAPALPAGQAAALLASRLASQSFGAGDIGRYQQLITAGTRANLAENFASAERAYRAAYALQQKALGKDDPNTATPLMLVALQMSNQGRTADADAAFAQAARLVEGRGDGVAQARLQHYRGLNALNAGKPGDALPLLRTAEAGYASNLPPDLLAIRPVPAARPITVSGRGGTAARVDDAPLLQPDEQAALIGVIETRRYQAIALRGLGRTEEARAAIRAAEDLASARQLRQRDLTARLSRTRSLADDAADAGAGEGLMRRASADFSDAQPGTRPVAQTLLLRAGQAMRGGDLGGDSGAALPLCRQAVTLLRELKAGTEAGLMSPCLAAFAAEAGRQPGARQALLAGMFEASQLVQGGVTARQIALASARLGENAKNPRVGEAIRRQQDAGLVVADLQRQVDAVALGGRPVRPGAGADDLAKQLAAAQAALADADAALQAAAPNYGQLVQQVAGADEVLAALAPDEAFVSLALEPDRGWVFVLRDGKVGAVRTTIGATAAAALVGRIRATVEPGAGGAPPPFDTAAAQALYDGTLGPAAPLLDGARALAVVPVGPLLSLPFEVMLTGPASQDSLASAPWLMQRFAITHVPAPANFVSLRRVAGTGGATQPWYGFGDFRPVTLQQAALTFPSGACRDSARLFAGLPPLPFAVRELTAARLLLGGGANDSLLGAAFTAPGVLGRDLRAYRVLHFASHALLPTDLACASEPAIVTSNPSGAANARGALLTASDVTAMQLDADVVILSACNSGGPDGATSGESLSGLARAFFYAGARAMLVTHWSINDQATALLIAGTLQRLKAGDPRGLAGAFQEAQRSMLADAGRGLPAAIAHPFYWAPFALVGEGRGRTVSAGRSAGNGAGGASSGASSGASGGRRTVAGL